MTDSIFAAEAPDWDLYLAGFSTFSQCARDLEADLTPDELVEQGWQIIETVHPFSPDQQERTWTAKAVPGVGIISRLLITRIIWEASFWNQAQEVK